MGELQRIASGTKEAPSIAYRPKSPQELASLAGSSTTVIVPVSK
jgi:hypothetical protein